MIGFAGDHGIWMDEKAHPQEVYARTIARASKQHHGFSLCLNCRVTLPQGNRCMDPRWGLDPAQKSTLESDLQRLHPSRCGVGGGKQCKASARVASRLDLLAARGSSYWSAFPPPPPTFTQSPLFKQKKPQPSLLPLLERSP